MTWANEVAAHREALETGFAIFDRTPHEALLWLTTVIMAYVVTLDDNDISQVIIEDIHAYHAERARIFKQSGRTYRNRLGWTRYCGTIEIDLVHPNIASRCSRTKAGLLAELGIDVTALRPDQRVVIVHEHAVIDHRGHASADIVTRDMRKAWPGPRRVHAARLHDTGTVAQNLRNLADYGAKFRFRYSVAWNGQKTTYLSDFEPEWRDYVRRLYRQIGIPRLINANVKSQAGAISDRGEMHTAPPKHRAKTAEKEAFQLCVLPKTIVGRLEEQTRSCNKDDMMEDIKITMKINEIISDHMELNGEDVRHDVEVALARKPPGLSDAEIAIMYGNADEELRLEKLRLDIRKAQAEILKTLAAAAKDRAAAAQKAGTHPRH